MFSLPPFEVLGKLRASALLVKHLNCESHLKIWLVLRFADARFRFCPFSIVLWLLVIDVLNDFQRKIFALRVCERWLVVFMDQQ